ncbi:hypothetical protein [Paraburkholderia atlantica]|uniref:hypothetical protein n=1 Tax=Paraburkholderia atlantica TaxID=2654982 RepID=UPI0012FEF2ED|nr:hypothetical protein [Paraburkholderia atlantica]
MNHRTTVAMMSPFASALSGERLRQNTFHQWSEFEGCAINVNTPVYLFSWKTKVLFDKHVGMGVVTPPPGHVMDISPLRDIDNFAFWAVLALKGCTLPVHVVAAGSFRQKESCEEYSARPPEIFPVGLNESPAISPRRYVAA